MNWFLALEKIIFKFIGCCNLSSQQIIRLILQYFLFSTVCIKKFSHAKNKQTTIRLYSNQKQRLPYIRISYFPMRIVITIKYSYTFSKWFCIFCCSKKLRYLFIAWLPYYGKLRTITRPNAGDFRKNMAIKDNSSLCRIIFFYFLETRAKNKFQEN